MINFQAYRSFGLNVCRRYIRSLSDWKDVSTRFQRDLLKDDGSRTVQVSVGFGKKTDRGTLYVKDVADVLLKQIVFCRKDDIMFPLQGEWFFQELLHQICVRCTVVHVTKK